MKQILITDGMAAEGVTILKNGKEINVELRKSTDPSELLAMIDRYDCLVVRSATKVTKDVIEKANNLKLICRAGAGVDNVDVEAASAKKIAVMNTASANSLAAAEHAIALLFSMFRNIPQAQQSMREQRWDRALFSGFEVTGKTLGVLGLGNIGRIVADRALGLRMNVLGFDPFVKSEADLPKEFQGRVKVASDLDSVLRSSDVVTLHLPLNKDTRGLLNKDRLSVMKDGSFLINCARGGIADENAVCDLLDSGKLKSAAFDVFEKEPVSFPNRLASHPKAIVTPHLGASTAEAQQRVALVAAQQIVNYFTNGDRTGVLN
ncbi:MAG: hydroxyacid dehydrogenase [Bacteriovoracia bacterium]